MHSPRRLLHLSELELLPWEARLCLCARRCLVLGDNPPETGQRFHSHSHQHNAHELATMQVQQLLPSAHADRVDRQCLCTIFCVITLADSKKRTTEQCMATARSTLGSCCPPVHALVGCPGRRGGPLALQHHVEGGDAVAPPQLPRDAPVPDVVHPPAGQAHKAVSASRPVQRLFLSLPIAQCPCPLLISAMLPRVFVPQTYASCRHLQAARCGS